VKPNISYDYKCPPYYKCVTFTSDTTTSITGYKLTSSALIHHPEKLPEM
jgi:hypothetical protein